MKLSNAGENSSPYINAGGKDKNTFDAIVVGSGISGGWAAKELCENGLKTLVLERGRNIEHIKDYDTASKAPIKLVFHLLLQVFFDTVHFHRRHKFLHQAPAAVHRGCR